jgi:DME family drug/metabolite transporter
VETTYTIARPLSRRGLPFIVAAAVLWGTVGIATKALYGIAETTPLSIGFLRLALSVPALLLACWALLGARTFRVSRRDLGLMALIGAMMALYQVCYFASIALVGVSIAVLVTLCMAPVLVALLSTALLRERLAPQVLLALACAIMGTLLLVGGGPAQGGAWNTLWGVLLALGSALGYAVLALCSRTLAGRYHPLQPITIGFAAGALILLPFALGSGLALNYSFEGWLLLLHLGLVPTALAYALFLYGMRHTSATVASIVTLLEPLTSTALAALLFGERLGPLGVVGAALLLGTIGLISRGEKHDQIREGKQERVMSS